MSDLGLSATTPRRRPARPAAARLRVGLVNNMADAALLTTERQFARLLGPEVDVQLFHLPEVERGEAARRRLRSRYRPVTELAHARVDGLIVTGAEPRASHLSGEPYWPSFRRLVDWARDNTASTIWSCLAAHAAVLHLDGIERRRLERKCSGVFERTTLGADVGFGGERSWVPHSRHNTLDEADLVRAGYAIVSRAEGVGVDTFVRQGRSRFVFFQGHPEYDADSLGLEFRRDVARFVRGHGAALPELPVGYFDPAVERELRSLVEGAADGPTDDISLRVAERVAGRAKSASWRASARTFYREWLSDLDRVPSAGDRAGALG